MHIGNHGQVTNEADWMAGHNHCRWTKACQRQHDCDLCVRQMVYFEPFLTGSPGLSRSHTGKTKTGESFEKFLGKEKYDEHLLNPSRDSFMLRFVSDASLL